MEVGASWFGEGSLGLREDRTSHLPRECHWALLQRQCHCACRCALRNRNAFISQDGDARTNRPSVTCPRSPTVSQNLNSPMGSVVGRVWKRPHKPLDLDHHHYCLPPPPQPPPPPPQSPLRGYGGRGRGRLYTYRYTVTTRMTPALRWAAMRAILMFRYTRQCPQTTAFEGKGEPKRIRT